MICKKINNKQQIKTKKRNKNLINIKYYKKKTIIYLYLFLIYKEFQLINWGYMNKQISGD